MSVAVFYSYAQADQNMLAELDEHLVMLRRKGLITVWSAQQVAAGQNQAEEIRKHLENAQLILLLISPSYVADEECYAQMLRAAVRARESGIVVVPVLARLTEGLDQAPIDGLEMLPKGGKPITTWKVRDMAYNSIAVDIRRLVEYLQPVSRSEKSALRSLSAPPVLLDSRAVYSRVNLVHKIYDRLQQPDTSALVLTGMGGIGKSTLAALVFQYAEERRLAGAGPFIEKALRFRINPTTTFLDLVEALCQALGKPEFNYADLTAQDQAIALFNLLYQCDAPRLILLDQFEEWLDAQTGAVLSELAGVGEWLDNINGQMCKCRLLITSRIWPQGAHIYREVCMQEFPVDGLQKNEGIALLRQWGMQESDADLALAVERCKGLPLALVLLDKLQRSSGLSLPTLLNDPNYRQLWVDNVGSNLFDYIYWQQLNDSQRDLLFAFSIYRTPVSKQAARVIAQNKLSSEQLTMALNGLQTRGLLYRESINYELHPLISEFARKRFLANMEHTQSDVLYNAHNQAAQYYLSQFTIISQPRQRQRVEDVQYLIEAAWHYSQAGQQQTAYALIKKEHIFTDLHRWGRNAVLLELYISLLPSPDWQPDDEQEANIYNEIGEIYNALGQRDKAQQYFEKAIALFKQIEVYDGEVKALNNLGAVYRSYGLIEQALSFYKEATDIYLNHKDKVTRQGTTLNNIGKAYQSLGQNVRLPDEERKYNYNLSLEYYQRAIAIRKDDEDIRERAQTYNNIGEAYMALKQKGKAQQYYSQAQDLYLEIGDLRGEGIVYNDLGVWYDSSSEKQAAFECYTQALSILREIGDRWEEATVLRNLGRLFASVERFDAALACFWLASSIADAIHKNIDAPAVPLWIRRSLSEEEFERLWSQVESQASRMLDQAIRDGLPAEPDEDDQAQ